MPDQDIAAQWKSFDPEKRDRLLKKMSPEQKKILRGKLEGKSVASPKLDSAAPQNPGLFKSWFEDLKGLVRPGAVAPYPGVDLEGKQAIAEQSSEQNESEKQAGYSTPYRVAATLGSSVGVNVPGVEESAAKGDVGGVVGHLLAVPTVMAAGEVGGRALSKVGELRARGAEAGKVQSIVRKVTGVENAVKESVGKAADKHAEALAARPAEVKEHFQKTQDVKNSNEEAATQHSTKAALDTGIEKLSKDFSEELTQLDKKVRSQANDNYATVRAKVGDATIPRTNLAEAVKSAEGKLQGSSENIKVFRDILTKSDAMEDVVHSGGQKFGPGTPLYESVKASPLGLPNEASPATFADLQGYYSELGDKLSSGGLPGDVYQAMKGLRENIGQMMQSMADGAGAGAEFKQAQKFYHDYMTTFRDNAGPSGSGSPVAQSRLAKDPAYVRKPFTGESGNRGVEMLAKYSPDLAKKAREIAKYQEQSDSIPAKSPKPKEAPKLSPRPESPTVDVNKVARDAIANRAKNWGSFNARDIGILGSSVIAGTIQHAFTGGGLELPTAAIAYEGGKYAASRALNNPKVVEWLAKTPQAEIDAINKIPGADKVRIVDGITNAAVKSGKTVNLSPQARQLLGPGNVAKILAVTSAQAPRIRNRQDALTALGR